MLLISFFFIRVFFHGHWQLTGQQGKGGDLYLFHSTTSTRSRTFRHLCATLHVRWLFDNERFIRSSRTRMLFKRMFSNTLQYSHGNACVGVSFGQQLHWKETPTQVFSWKYCEIFKNSFFEKLLWTTASEILKLFYKTFWPD